MTNHTLGQYFTTNESLLQVLLNWIKNNPSVILEPSIGRGDIVSYITSNTNFEFDMYELDNTIELLPDINRDNVNYGDFLKYKIIKRYDTIVGNPPYVRTKHGNLYIDFISKCIDLLDDNGELIFIVPSDLFKLTSAVILINKMFEQGSITHVYHPHDEHLFENATIDIIIFRYQKNTTLEKICLYNDELKYIINNNGMITFAHNLQNMVSIGDIFDVFVGMVSGKESVFKTPIGNIDVITAENKIEKYIFIDKIPSGDDDIDQHMLNNKEELINRRIRHFTDLNWFQWGAPRNLSTIKRFENKPCIYVHNLTRNKTVAFKDKVRYFGGNLIMLYPKKKINLDTVVDYINSEKFKTNFTFSGRFKIGQRHLVNAQISI